MASCFRERLSLPEDISLCSRTADSTESADISYEIQNNWGDGFIAAVTVKNTYDKPLEAWKLSFNGNFDISTIWNANLLYTDDGSFKVENDITTTPIPVGGEKVFSFQGIIASGETPALSDFKLTSIVIDTERIQPVPPVETEEAHLMKPPSLLPEMNRTLRPKKLTKPKSLLILTLLSLMKIQSCALVSIFLRKSLSRYTGILPPRAQCRYTKTRTETAGESSLR